VDLCRLLELCIAVRYDGKVVVWEGCFVHSRFAAFGANIVLVDAGRQTALTPCKTGTVSVLCTHELTWLTHEVVLACLYECGISNLVLLLLLWVLLGFVSSSSCAATEQSSRLPVSPSLGLDGVGSCHTVPTLCM
jgi:hypothetical protein